MFYYRVVTFPLVLFKLPLCFEQIHLLDCWFCSFGVLHRILNSLLEDSFCSFLFHVWAKCASHLIAFFVRKPDTDLKLQGSVALEGHIDKGRVEFGSLGCKNSFNECFELVLNDQVTAFLIRIFIFVGDVCRVISDLVKFGYLDHKGRIQIFKINFKKKWSLWQNCYQLWILLLKN